MSEDKDIGMRMMPLVREFDERIDAASRASIELWGPQRQALKAAEECAELAAELVAYVNGESSLADVAREAADVRIVLAHVERIVGAQRYDNALHEKLTRFERFVAEQKAKDA